MSDASQKYKHLEVQLLGEELSQEEEDFLLEQMDDLWWQMTPEERTTANDRRGTTR